MQDKALQDIERLIIENMRDIDNYSDAFLNLASKSGQAFTQNMSDKYFSKLPPPFNSIIKDEWYKVHPTRTRGIAPRIVFTKEYLKRKCIENEVAKQVKDYNFCKQVYIPGYFPKDKKRIRELLIIGMEYLGKITSGNSKAQTPTKNVGAMFVAKKDISPRMRNKRDNESVAVSCIIDSGASRSCISPNAIPKHFYEEMYGQVWIPKDCERLSLVQAGVLDPDPENYGDDGMFDDEYMADTD
ncbi:hypothetical protein K1719_033742 [Acacia pycnantha]|nr:hypothetical protein K1719_033742 [Acacia pycnantha]